jgi:predicted RNA binding protein YcfA (HicA-like mRNA interferase family)
MDKPRSRCHDFVKQEDGGRRLSWASGPPRPRPCPAPPGLALCLVVKPLGILEAAKVNPAGVRFTHLVKLVLAMGYEFERQKGSHGMYRRPGFPRIDIQPRKSMAKDYQVRRVIEIIDQYGIEV